MIVDFALPAELGSDPGQLGPMRRIGDVARYGGDRGRVGQPGHGGT